ncbi:MAG: VWA domain-containing protein [Acidobacteria bacterium]|nr:VWA domain-containing protein [Acidobacteriota bacterium]
MRITGNIFGVSSRIPPRVRSSQLATRNSKPAKLMAMAMAALMLQPASAFPEAQKAPFRLSVNSELVLVNVIARDRQGNFIRDLKPEDFTVSEDGKPQKISSFDFENIDTLPFTAGSSAPAAGPAQIIIQGAKPAPTAAPVAPTADALRNRRLIVMFFDLSGMDPDQIERSVKTAEEYLDKRMTAADLISVVSLGTQLAVNQDFTGDKAVLSKAIAKLNPSSGAGFEQGGTGDTESTPDDANPFSADDTEFNIFNTDRRLEALKTVALGMAQIEQKKSLIYFSAGISQTGVENQAELRSAVNAAVQANVAIYAVDIRGLEAMPPGGAASQASLRGVGSYSGDAIRGQYDQNFATQETLYTVSHDTGGQAFLDSNDFGKVFERVQQDTSSYYVLGYRSTNPARDGRYRHIQVRATRKDVKLEYRSGYYAPRDFQHSTVADREDQLQAELASDLPSTDLPIYLSTAYFRGADGRFFVPVSIVVPGADIPFTRNADKDKATLDIIGLVRDTVTKFPMGNARETVKLNLDESQQVRRRNVQYNTGFTLPPGTYHLKFVVRENQSGRMGSFETDLVIPDLKKATVKMSAVALGSRLQPAPRRKTDNPLVRDGNELLLNVAHVFNSNQTLYFYYEVYDPAKAKPAEAAGAKQPPRGSVRVLSSVAFFNGKLKAYETPLVELTELNAPDRHAAAFQLQVPLDKLHPGLYTCQINVIDDAGGSFAFPRVALLVRESKAPGSN